MLQQASAESAPRKRDRGKTLLSTSSCFQGGWVTVKTLEPILCPSVFSAVHLFFCGESHGVDIRASVLGRGAKEETACKGLRVVQSPQGRLGACFEENQSLTLSPRNVAFILLEQRRRKIPVIITLRQMTLEIRLLAMSTELYRVREVHNNKHLLARLKGTQNF